MKISLTEVNVKKEIAIAAVMGFIMNALVSYLIASFVTPMPADAAANVIDNMITGGICGCMGGVMAMAVFFFLTKKKAAKTSDAQ